MSTIVTAAEFTNRRLALDVRERGATGDGSTDDSAAIQDALDSAGPDGIVFLPRGTYILFSGLTVPDDVTLIGAGKGSVLSRGYTGGAAIVELSGTRSRLRDLCVSGQYSVLGSHGTGEVLLSGESSSVVDCLFIDWADAAAAMTGDHASVVGCEFVGSPTVDTGYDTEGHRYGIWADVAAALGQVIRGCTFRNTYWNAVFIGSRGARIIDCSAYTCHIQATGTGGGMFDASGNATDIVFSGCLADGTDLDSGSTATSGFETNGSVDLVGCTVRNVTNHGIILQDNSRTGYRVTGCRIVAAAHGITVNAGVTWFQIVGNLIRDCTTDGVKVATGASDFYHINSNVLKSNGTDLTDGGTGSHKLIHDNIPNSVNV